MRCNHIARQHAALIKGLAVKAAEAQLDDAIIRTGNLWRAAMFRAGVPSETVSLVDQAFTEICAEYAKYKRDGVADAALLRDLNRVGARADIPSFEL